MQIAPDDTEIFGQACLAQRLAVPRVAILTGRDRGQVAEEGDAPVTMADEVPDGRDRAVPVVGQHAVGGQQLGRPVHEDDGGADPAEAILAGAERRRIRAAIEELPQRQRAIVVAHYFNEQPLRALSDKMRVSPQRVSQLHVAAIQRMRRILAPA